MQGLFRLGAWSLALVVPYALEAQPLHQELVQCPGSGANPCIVHKVRKSETLYGIARRYGIPSSSFLNPHGLKVEGIPLSGDTVYIPVATRHLAATGQPSASLLYYLVKPKDGIYALCRRLFKIPTAQLYGLNALEGRPLKPGDTLVVGYFIPDEVWSRSEIGPKADSRFVRDTAFSEPERLTSEASFAQIQRSVVHVEASGFGEGRYFALHATAQMDSRIEVYNPLNGRRVKAKVIGRIPPVYESAVNVIVSSAVARALGVPDNRFFGIVSFN
ncbi:MAG: LysM peptidoglycan-binding domain-containing protein [Saprospiraceae bacterium]|nr:LysM peptidoglycan-binding domain-containing protein [Saprospiraceae bacterium]